MKSANLKFMYCAYSHMLNLIENNFSKVRNMIGLNADSGLDSAIEQVFDSVTRGNCVA